MSTLSNFGLVPYSSLDPAAMVSDDPTNASGLGASCIFNKTIFLHRVSGVTVGSGQSQATRIATLTAMQAAVTYAIAHGYAIYAADGYYEIYGTAGLVINPNASSGWPYGFRWYGSKAVRIIQFYMNAPCVTWGDTGGTNYGWAMFIEGMRIEYGISQANISITGNTNTSTSITNASSTTNLVVGQAITGSGIPANTTITAIAGTTLTISNAATATATGVALTITNTGANCLVLGAMKQCRFINIKVGADFGGYTAPNTPSQYPAYRCVYNPTSLPGSFSNTFEDWEIGGALYCLLELDSLGTGSNFRNFYIANGYNGASGAPSADSPGYLTGSAIIVGATTSYNGGTDGNWDQINLEGCAANVLINWQNIRATNFRSLHVEGCFLTGANPTVFNSAGGRIHFTGINANVIVLATMPAGLTTLTAVTGTARFFSLYNDDQITVDNWYNGFEATGIITTSFILVNYSGFDTGSDNVANVQIRQMTTVDHAAGASMTFMALDNRLTTTNFKMPAYVQEYWTTFVQARTLGCTFAVSATFTHYCCHDAATIEIPASVTSFTLNLSPYMVPNTPGSSLKGKAGQIVRIRRLSGTAAGTVTIYDVATSTTLSTNTTSGVDIYSQFNGTSWAVAT